MTLGIARGTTALCPAAALEAWLKAAGITMGPVFNSLAPTATYTANVSRRVWLP